MSVEENKKLALRYLEEVYNKKNFTVLDEPMTENAVAHRSWAPATVVGRPNPRKMREVCPDLAVEVEDCFGEGDSVAVRFRQFGTHRGVVMGVPGTGKKFSNEELFVFRFEDKKIAEVWIFLNLLDRAEQLGFKLVPPGSSE